MAVDTAADTAAPAWVDFAAPAVFEMVADIAAEVRVEVEFGKFAEVDMV